MGRRSVKRQGTMWKNEIRSSNKKKIINEFLGERAFSPLISPFTHISSLCMFFSFIFRFPCRLCVLLLNAECHGMGKFNGNKLLRRNK